MQIYYLYIVLNKFRDNDSNLLIVDTKYTFIKQLRKGKQYQAIRNMNDKEMGENKTKDIIWRDYFQDISEIREIDDKKIEIH